MIRTDDFIIKPPPPLCDYIHWFVDPVITEYNSHGKLTNKAPGELDPNTSVLWGVYVDAVDYKFSGETNTFEEYEKGFMEHIGNVALTGIDWINRKAEFSCIFGNVFYWGKGYGTMAASLIFDHGFKKLNLNRIWLGTPFENKAMIKIAEKLKMKFEGCLAGDMFLNGKYVDVVRYGINKEQWKNR